MTDDDVMLGKWPSVSSYYSSSSILLFKYKHGNLFSDKSFNYFIPNIYDIYASDDNDTHDTDKI